ncbi:hypothetical protein SUGI_0168470 [Cryptomeria japonica]|nr:hypothetical protein SUGI_0168470 [Cryptomeria japonica]
MDEDAPDYYAIVQNPMDITTLLQRVDNRHYLTCSVFLQDVELIPANAKILGMLSQMDPALVAFCDKIAAQGGPTRLSEDSTTNFPSNPVAQPVHITRASECLRNVQPDMNVSQSYEVLKRSKQNSDPDQGKVVAGDSDPFAEDRSQPMEIDTPLKKKLERLYALISRRVISLADANKPTIFKESFVTECPMNCYVTRNATGELRFAFSPSRTAVSKLLSHSHRNLKE